MNQAFATEALGLATSCGEAIVAGLWRATWQAAVLIPLVWLLERLWVRMSPLVRAWIWRGVYLKLLVALVVPGAIGLPVLPRESLPAATTSTAASTAFVAELSAIDAALPAASAAAPERGRSPWTLLFPGVVLTVWLAGLAVIGTRLVLEQRRAAVLVRRSRPLADPLIQQMYRQLGYQFGLVKAPPLRIAPGSGSPLLVGFARPAILLAEEFLASATRERIRMALAHELAHHIRRDLAWNRLAAAIDALLFFHPLVWLAGRRYELSQELACDELAVTRGRLLLADYANLVLDISTTGAAPRAALAVGVSGAFGTLRERLTAMKTISTQAARRPWWLPTLAVLGAVALVPWSLVPQSSADDGDKPAPGKSVAAARARPAASDDAQPAADATTVTARAGAIAVDGEKPKTRTTASLDTGDGPASDDPTTGRKTTTKSRTSKMTTTVEEDGEGWTRTITASEGDTSVKIVETSDGKIEMEVTVAAAGKDEAETYSAKDAAELKARYPSAFELYDKYTRRATARRGAAAASADASYDAPRTGTRRGGKQGTASGSSSTRSSAGGGAFGGFGGGGSLRGGGGSGSSGNTGGFGGGGAGGPGGFGGGGGFGPGGFGGGDGGGGGFGRGGSGGGGGFGGGGGGPGGGFGGRSGRTGGPGAGGGGGAGFAGGSGFRGFGGGAGGPGGSGGRASGGGFGGFGGDDGAGGNAKEMLRKQLEELKKNIGDNEQLRDLVDRMLEDIDQDE